MSAEAATIDFRFNSALGYADATLGRTAMSALTIVVVCIWNGLLLGALVAAVHWRERVMGWITRSDGESRSSWEAAGDERWAAFLAEHPELSDR
jgi:hypothetical protein